MQMRNSPDRTPEALKVDVQELESLLNRDNSITTERLKGHDLTTIKLTRVIAEDMDEAVEQYMEVINNMSNLTDYAQTVEGLDHFNKLSVSPEGDIFCGYSLMQVRTDGQSTNNTIGIAIDTDGLIQKIEGPNHPTTQDAINATINSMVEALRNRNGDHRESIRTAIDIGEQIEKQGIVERLDKSQPTEKVSKSTKPDDTIGQRKLSREEVVARLKKITSALRERVIALSPQAS